MIAWIRNYFCKHRNLGNPSLNFVRGNRGVFRTCLDCGKEIPYHQWTGVNSGRKVLQ